MNSNWFLASFPLMIPVFVPTTYPLDSFEIITPIRMANLPVATGNK